jgi:hypothetical protein
MAKEYVEERDGGYYVAGMRVSLQIPERYQRKVKALIPLIW